MPSMSVLATPTFEQTNENKIEMSRDQRQKQYSGERP